MDFVLEPSLLPLDYQEVACVAGEGRLWPMWFVYIDIQNTYLYAQILVTSWKSTFRGPNFLGSLQGLLMSLVRKELTFLNSRLTKRADALESELQAAYNEINRLVRAWIFRSNLCMNSHWATWKWVLHLQMFFIMKTITALCEYFHRGDTFILVLPAKHCYSLLQYCTCILHVPRTSKIPQMINQYTMFLTCILIC